MLSIYIRPGTPEDPGFLRKMLYEAAYWRASIERPPLEGVLAHSGLAILLRDWGRRPGDTAETAVAADGRRVDAAWYRFWPATDHSYGFVDERLPELGIGVASGSRGQGIGTALLRALVDRATGEGVPGLSLSVERGNPASRLYEGLGSQPGATEGNSLTMVLDLKGGGWRMLTDQQDAYGHMLLDHLAGTSAHEIIERNDGFFTVGWGPNLYFSPYPEWQPSAKEALKHARGRVLDVGCGAGRHALYLQSQGCNVLGTDISPGAIRVCLARGLRQATVLPVTSISSRLGRFDTILMLGNNFGLFATPERARWLLRRLHRATPREGRIIAGSIDPRRTDDPDHLAYHQRNLARGRLPGELRIRVRYRKFVTPWFGLLLVSQDEMAAILEGTGWSVSRFLSDGGASYVAVIEKQPELDPHPR